MVATVVGHLSFSSTTPSLSPPLPPRRRFSAAASKSLPMASMTMSEDPIREWILSEGKATQITGTRPVGGGCINRAYRYETDVGSFFVKTNRSIGPSMFEGEALGLGAMYETRTIRVPKPFKFGPLPSGGSYIIMEFVEFGASRSNQVRTASSSFLDILLLLLPLDIFPVLRLHSGGNLLRCIKQERLRKASVSTLTIQSEGQRLIKNMTPLFNGATLEPCLLHGDLWSGNISYDKNGEPLILDPACYYGHNEAEFGMSWCAGFGGSFYKAYFEVMPKQPGFDERMDLYMLYHYLNHYNLFGSGYRSSAMSIIDDYLRILGA